MDWALILIQQRKTVQLGSACVAITSWVWDTGGPRALGARQRGSIPRIQILWEGGRAANTEDCRSSALRGYAGSSPALPIGAYGVLAKQRGTGLQSL